MASLLKTLALGGIAAWAYQAWKKNNAEPATATAGGTGYVRDAGPSEQRGMNDRDWDSVDQQSDESFPASDPPANY
jgi:uncharacterized membrane protein YebE (DUF533 family)